MGRDLGTLWLAILLIAGLTVLLGCPSEPSDEEGGNTQKVTAEPPVEQETGPVGELPSETKTTEAVIDPSAATEETTDHQISQEAFAAWEIDGFYIGMSVMDARQLISGVPPEKVTEIWKIENEIGMILAGSYEKEGDFVGSLMFFDGKLAAVIKNSRLEYSFFYNMYTSYKSTYGNHLISLPEFASDRRFLAEMIHDEKNKPDLQYMWAKEDEELILVLGYYNEPQLLLNFLIDAKTYDLVAEEIQSMQ